MELEVRGGARGKGWSYEVRAHDCCLSHTTPTPRRDLGLLKGELLVFSEQLAMRVEQYCGSHYNMKTTMTNALQQRDGDYTKVGGV